MMKRRTSDELRKAFEHLRYEMWMLESLAQALAADASSTSVIHNALLESFAIHARVLIDVFYPKNREPRDVTEKKTKKRKSDDVTAEDFFEDTEKWLSRRLAKTGNLEKVHERVGKEIAHLTYKRQELTEEMKLWPFTDIAKDMDNVFGSFLEAACNAKRPAGEMGVEDIRLVLPSYTATTMGAELTPVIREFIDVLASGRALSQEESESGSR